MCPDNAYCEQGSVAPVPCSALSHCVCDGGCAQPPVALAVQVAVILIAIVLLLYAAWRFWGRARWAAYAKARKARRRLTQRPISVFLPRKASSAAAAAAATVDALSSPLLAEESGDPRPSSVRFTLPANAGEARGSSINAAASADGRAPFFDRAASSSSFGSAFTQESAPVSVAPPGYRSSMRWGVGGVRSALSAAAAADAAVSHKRFTLAVRFDGLSLALKGGSKAKVRGKARSERPQGCSCKHVLSPSIQVLHGVTGELKPGRVVAVMGPSGGGKSSFLTTLAGKASYGVVSGSVFINGEQGWLTDPRYKHLVGFVPQDDIMLRDLTVEENIGAAAEGGSLLF